MAEHLPPEWYRLGYQARALAYDWIRCWQFELVPLEPQEIAAALGLPREARRRVRRLMEEMVRKGVLHARPGLGYSLVRLPALRCVGKGASWDRDGTTTDLHGTSRDLHGTSTGTPNAANSLPTRARAKTDRETDRKTPPTPPGGDGGDAHKLPGLWGAFDPSRAAEYVEALWAVWGEGHPDAGLVVQQRLASRLQRWLGGLTESERRTRLQALVAWVQGPYQPRDKIRALLNGDWGESLRAPAEPAQRPQEGRQKGQWSRSADEVTAGRPSPAEARRAAEDFAGPADPAVQDLLGGIGRTP